jgi:hypothetical protein
LLAHTRQNIPDGCREACTAEQTRFAEVCQTVLDGAHRAGGIGTLGEKSLHAILKHYYEANPTFHEVQLGPYYADVCTERGILEIQTRQFDKIKKKLAYFLPDHPVTVVYPIARHKWISWLDEESGELSKPRKSPKTGSCYEIFRELFHLRAFLQDPHLHFLIVFVDMEEYRLLNGWSRDKKKGATRHERIPVRLVGEMPINSAADIARLIPGSLPRPFTAADFRKATKLSPRWTGVALRLLKDLGHIEQTGKRGRAFLYECARNNEETAPKAAGTQAAGKA